MMVTAPIASAHRMSDDHHHEAYGISAISGIGSSVLSVQHISTAAQGNLCSWDEDSIDVLKKISPALRQKCE